MRSDGEKHAHEDGIALAFLELLSNNQDFILPHWLTERLEMNSQNSSLKCLKNKNQQTNLHLPLSSECYVTSDVS